MRKQIGCIFLTMVNAVICKICKWHGAVRRVLRPFIESALAVQRKEIAEVEKVRSQSVQILHNWLRELPYVVYLTVLVEIEL